MDINELKDKKRKLTEQHADLVISDLVYLNECINLYLGDKKSGKINISSLKNVYDDDEYISIIEMDGNDEYGDKILKYCTIHSISFYKKKNNLATLRFDISIDEKEYENVPEYCFYQLDYTEIGDYILNTLEKNLLSKCNLVHDGNKKTQN